MTEAKLITISDEQWRWAKNNNIKLSLFVQNSIDHARCVYEITIRKYQQEWIESHHINLSLIIQDALDAEMNGNG